MSENRYSDTRTRILDAAESLFMAHGYEGTSMRQITGAASVNLASVNYHFGSKEQLIQEVLRRRLDPLNEARMRVLDAMELAAGAQPLDPARIIDGFFGTLLRLARDPEQGGTVFLRLLGRTVTEPSPLIRQFLALEYASVMERYKAALYRALPDLPQEEVVWRFHFMLGASSYAIAAIDAVRLVSEGGEGAAAFDEKLLARLLSFLEGGLVAPLPSSA